MWKVEIISRTEKGKMWNTLEFHGEYVERWKAESKLKDFIEEVLDDAEYVIKLSEVNTNE